MGIDIGLFATICSDPLLRCGFVAGGPVRDLFLAREPVDLDIVLPSGAIEVAETIAKRYHGKWVSLHQEEGIARVVFPGLLLDFSQFRGGSKIIEEDLGKRDFTINAMAIPISSAPQFLEAHQRPGAGELIDPFGGVRDCEEGVIRAISRENLADDPLRLLRVFRFSSQLGFRPDSMTISWVEELAPTIRGVAAERVWHELSLITASPRASTAFKEMYARGLLGHILPELLAMEGVEQPGFHHLDVFGHCMEALSMAEALISDPGMKFSPSDPIAHWCSPPANIVALKWAALLHDVAKPVCRGEKEGRPTFYRHDHAGADMVMEIAGRLRWPGWLTAQVQTLVKLHMRPFHLLNDLARGGPSKRAMRRLLKEVGEDYPGLFALAMADSMAGCGPLKPPDLDDRLNRLWALVHAFYQKSLKPIEEAPRLLNGHDVMTILGIGPGPQIGLILDGLEEARIEGEVGSREEAEEWVRRHAGTLLEL